MESIDFFFWDFNELSFWCLVLIIRFWQYSHGLDKDTCTRAKLIQSNKYFQNLFVSSICLLLLLKIQYEWESSYFEYSNTVSANIPIDPRQKFFTGISAFQFWTRCKCTCEPLESVHKTFELAVTELLCIRCAHRIKHRMQC